MEVKSLVSKELLDKSTHTDGVHVQAYTLSDVKTRIHIRYFIV